MKMATLKMDNLTCPSCVRKIEGTLSKQKGVKQARVLFSSNKGIVEFDETVTSSNDLTDVVKKLGYAVLETKVK